MGHKDGKRHFSTVNVKLCRPQNNQRKAHVDDHFAFASVKHAKELACLFGKPKRRMHSTCRIPELPNISTGLTTMKSQLCQGLGELTSKDPAWKIRRKNQVCGRRLLQHIAILNQQCVESTSRINHDIRRVRSLLISPSISCPALSSLSAFNQPKRPLCSTTGARSIGSTGSQQSSSVSSACSKHGKRILKDNTDLKNTSSFDIGFGKYEKINEKSQSTLRKGEKIEPTVVNSLPIKEPKDFVHSTKQDFTVTASSCDNQLPKHSQRWNFSARRCGYGESSTPKNCYHFPCKRPQTYSHIGFRGNHPQLKIFQWKRNSNGTKTNRAESWVMRTGQRTPKPSQENRVGDRAESLKHRLPSAIKLRPLDTAFREQLLREEAERRRRVHQRSRPADWEINYGQPTPFKRLWYPVRLKPNELVSW